MTILSLTVQDMVDIIRREIVDEDSATYRWTDAQIIPQLNLASLEIVRDFECLETNTTKDTVALQYDYSLADDYLKLYGNPFYYDGGTYYEIFTYWPDFMEFLRARLLIGSSGGRPTEYSLWNDKLWIYPSPPAVTSGLQYWYYKKPAVFAATALSSQSSDLKSEYHRLLIYRALMDICRQDKQLTTLLPKITDVFNYERKRIEVFKLNKIKQTTTYPGTW